MDSMHDVFISYSAKEMSTAVSVRGILEKNGISCWMAPENIPGGSNYTKEIPVAIRNCQVFVLILSENAQKSQWVLKELDTAVNCGKVILPFMLEDFQLNDEFNFLLTGAQRYDAYQKKAEAMANLIKRIQAVIETDPASDDAPQEQSASDTKEEPKEKITVVDAFLSMGVCPACGSEAVSQLPGIGKYIRREEKIYGLGVIAACVLVFFPATILLAFVPSALLWLGTWILGTVLLTKVFRRWSDKRVHNLRVRSHVRPNPYRCDKCNWVFLLHDDGSVVQTKKK